MGSSTQHWWLRKKKYRSQCVEDNIEDYKPNVDLKTYCFFITQRWWGQHKMKKPNVDFKTYCFFTPNIDGDNIGWKNPTLTLKHTVVFTTQHWWGQHRKKNPNVDVKTYCFVFCHNLKKTNVAKNSLDFKVKPNVGIGWKKPMLT